jgi:murein L,D-transpeptidase YcbB/YkuD
MSTIKEVEIAGVNAAGQPVDAKGNVVVAVDVAPEHPEQIFPVDPSRVALQGTQRTAVNFRNVKTLAKADGEAKEGSVADTKRVQEELIKLGWSIDENGYGVQTEIALKRFQAERGILPDGVLGPITKELLFGELEEREDIVEVREDEVAAGDKPKVKTVVK